DAFIDRLCSLSILDPACGSGNFLYLALQGVKDLEWKALLECETLGLGRPLPRVSPRILHGIEINPLAAELARSVIWIGDIQWGIANGLSHRPEPILEKLDSIECRDALVAWGGDFPSPLAGEGGAARSAVTDEGSHDASGEGGATPHPSPLPQGERGPVVPIEALWPPAEFIVGNPPFLGGKKLRSGLGDETVETLFKVFDGKVPREADLVAYWFEKARHQIATGQTRRAGLVTTNSIRGGANRKVIERMVGDAPIFEAWADEEWLQDGAAVRVSMVCFGQREEGEGLVLDGLPVTAINADLSAQAADLTLAKRLKENEGISFQGITKGAPFEVKHGVAIDWLKAPLNVNGRPNSDVLMPIRSGGDIVKSRTADWVIDFTAYAESEATSFEAPFEHCLTVVKPIKTANARKLYREKWWLFSEPRPGLRAAIASLSRYIVTPKVAKFRPFVWFSATELADNVTVAIARDDDTSFGIVQSRFHEEWALRRGAYIGVGNDPTYTPTTTFETFPFPEGLTPNLPASAYADDPRAIRIAAAAKALDEKRRAWLNPPDLVEIVPEVVPTAAPGEEPRRYPDRILPKNAEAAVKLRERTLTNLYNQRPAWLAALHEDLDRAVAAAYGWPEDIATDEALARLLALNLERAAAGR
ncbi:DNA methyltransferase, partial [Bosea sp. (in: a-proteobacteria)]|uniref:DNA methyltransferase n=1 Tax=Bosea sp. (in: a-proteobacteria) TaxID=1871050 RepID=UPI00275109D6|nr:class I SAM-dependent DNA methyltransferase [Bosea sp. (in: a-proteobacteria)]